MDLREYKTLCLEIITCDPSIYTMDHADIIVCGFLENSIDPKRVKLTLYKVSNLLRLVLWVFSFSHELTISRKCNNAW